MKYDKEFRNALPAGTMLNGVYRIERCLGAGGFGIVYLAQHDVLGPAAIKEYLPRDLAVRDAGTVHPVSAQEQGYYEEGLRRFEAEARRLLQFRNHPGVVLCRDLFRENGTAYLVMDYEEGMSLAELLALREKEGRPFTEGELLAIAEPLLEGLAAVHRAEVLHRDIKPGNILVRRRDERPVLIDFGAAKEDFARQTKSHAPHTPGYAAMEQVGAAGNLGPWTDLYGLGAVLWRIVACGEPVDVIHRMVAISRGREDPLASARELGAGRFAKGTLAAIDRCMELQPEDRPADCVELLDLLRAARDAAAGAALGPGEKVREYVIEEVLGQGEYGVVYRARHRRLGTTVALKEYLPTGLARRAAGTVRAGSQSVRADYEAGLRGFAEEARRLVQIRRHASVVTCQRLLHERGTAYLVMDYEEGLPLSEELAGREAEGRPLGEEELLALAKPLLEGLAAVHAAGVLHRAVKPSNILLRRRDRCPVLIDFGAAKQEFVRRMQSHERRRPWDGATEQAGADWGRLGPWTDLFGLGMVLWRIVAGSSGRSAPPEPLGWGVRVEAKAQGGEDPLPTARELGAGLFSARVLGAIDRCLELKREDRPADCRELELLLAGREVERAYGNRTAGGEDETVGAEESSRGTSAEQRGVNRRPWRNQIGWVALLLALGVGGMLWWSGMGKGSSAGSRGGVELVRNSVGDIAGPGPGTGGPRAGERGEFDGMEFVWIPAGEFEMGSASEHAYDGEGPLTRVRISEGYWLGKHEVTQGEWAAVMGSNPSYFDECGGECPVENVSWLEVQEYISKLNGRGDGWSYRLPTEAEWEYAARAGTRGDTYAGDLRLLGKNNAPVLDGIAWYGGNSGVSYGGGLDCSAWEEKQYSSRRCGPQRVGQKGANAWGLHDMLGNVWEWVQDWYGEYPGGAVRDPTGPSGGSDRVDRGGGWSDDAVYCRSATRISYGPGNRSYDIGFRLLRTQ